VANGQILLPCLTAEIERECCLLRQVIARIVEVEAEQHPVVAVPSHHTPKLIRLLYGRSTPLFFKAQLH
jgi:hypothetical protein